MIKDDAKQIIEYLLKKAISYGTLKQGIPIQFDTLANELGLESKNYCRVCCDYLDQLNYVDFVDNGDIDNKDLFFAHLKANGIDFFESKS